jgi:hypothetical protein
MDEQRRNDFGRSPGQTSGDLRTKASAVADDVQKEGGRLGREVQEEGQRIGRELKEEGQELVGGVRHYVEDLAENGVKTVTERLHHMSVALHKAADSLRQEDEDSTSRIADQAAERIDQVCDYLERQEPMDMIRGLDRFARQQPMIAIGGMLIAGMMLGRFLRSSQRSDSGFDGGQPTSGRFQGQDIGYGQPRRVEVGMGIGSNPGLRPRGGPEASGQIGHGPEIGTRIGNKSEGDKNPGGLGTGRSGSDIGGDTGSFSSRPLTEPPRKQGGDQGGGQGFKGGV